ncbi:hypothetical protein [Streptomyces sp. NPDC006739]|uniref:hypothetical protein n=1 Tax=Streptomyces sp. NPDC006739 TaxID=3364763 RepID=UPI0036742C31
MTRPPGTELPQPGGQRDAGVEPVRRSAGTAEQQAVQQAADQFGAAPTGPRSRVAALGAMDPAA